MAGTTNDDELLILSDDSDNGSDFVLDEQIIDENKNSLSNNDLISFDSDISTDIELSNDLDLSNFGEEDTIKLSADEEVTEVIDNNSDDANNSFSFGLDETEPEVKLEDIKPEVKLEDTESNPFMEDDLKEEHSPKLNKTENISFGEDTIELVEESTSVGTMTDILDETISKFIKREELILSDVELKESQIKKLKNEITELEARVSSENEVVSKLNSEKQAIAKNRKALEKMKNDINTTEQEK